MVPIRRFAWLVALLVLIQGCSIGGSPQHQRVLLWHTWTGDKVDTLNAMIDAYRDLNPTVDVISVAVPESAIVSRLASSTESGLGPDLVLADAATVYQLATKGLIRDLGPLDLDLSSNLSTAVRMLSDSSHVYGLPLSAHTNVLYYDRAQVETPPTTVAELLERISGGDVLAQNPSFVDTYWGVGAYDGAFADSDSRLLFGQGGFTNWLDFLSSARMLPGFLLDDSTQDLLQAFIDGDATYFIGDSDLMSDLKEAMGPERLGVALLPSGPNGGAPSPLLNLDAFAFSKVSSDEEFSQALGFATFLGGPKSQLFLATTDVGLVPVNNQIRLTPSLPATTLTVARQARTAAAISFVNRPVWSELTAGALGFLDNYRRVSQGVLAPEDFVAQTMHDFEDAYGLNPPVLHVEDLCPAQPGTATIWHSLSRAPAQVFEELAAEFEAMCESVDLEVEYVPGAEFAGRFGEEASTGGGPDMLFGSSQWLASLAEQGLLLDLTELISGQDLQQFIPNAVETMRYEGKLYGIPESVIVQALYYNSTLVSDPPIDLHQLVQSVDADIRLALPVGFFAAYWGVEPYGVFEFDSSTGTLGDTTGLRAWLEELQSVDANPGVDLYFDFGDAEDAFAYEEAAFLVGDPSSLPRLRQELGDDRFRVVPLPSGPLKPGSPVLRTQGTMINANADEVSVEIALAFEQFLRAPESQSRFLATNKHVPASVTVSVADNPIIENFREEAKAALPVVENRNLRILLEHGDELYRSVLQDGIAPAVAVPEFIEAVEADTRAAMGNQEE